MAAPAHRLLAAPAEVEAYLHRMRMQILAALRGGAATSSQIAAKLGVHPANLTRHLRILLEAGLIEIAERRDTGRNLEKYYRATAASFEVALDAEKMRAPHKVALTQARSELSRAIAQLPDKAPGPVNVYVAIANLTSKRQAAFAAALADLAARFESAGEEQGAPFALVLSLHPSAEPPGGDKPVRLSLPRRKPS